MTSFATELETPSFTDVRYICMDTLPHLLYKDLPFVYCTIILHFRQVNVMVKYSSLCWLAVITEG